ncbi:MAG TPA: peroxide stress protein YaaA, partial [Kineosporiaceae bacterium]|nr:peroxide stress protein YaaA [Kineosporiaceae bacterium]
WGALRPADRIPPYRLKMHADVGLGPLPQVWRPVLGPVLEAAARGLVVDCRSGDYAAAWPASGAVAARTVAVRVLQDGPAGRSVVSHAAKHTRGEVARHLLETGADPARPQALARALAERWAVELTPPARPGKSWTLDVVLPVPSQA